MEHTLNGRFVVSDYPFRRHAPCKLSIGPGRLLVQSVKWPRQNVRPVARSAILLRLCHQDESSTFWEFEQALGRALALLARCLLQLFLASRERRLNLTVYLRRGRYRPAGTGQRTIKTVYGSVSYTRRYLVARRRKGGVHPLDVQLGLRNSINAGANAACASVGAVVSDIKDAASGMAASRGNAAKRGIKARMGGKPSWS